MNKLTQKQRSALQAERLKRGKRLKQWRNNQVYTQSEAALCFNVSIHTYAKWERGDSMTPDDVMAKI